MEQLVSQKIRYRKHFSKTDREWLEGHPKRFDQIMQHHISRRKHLRLEFWPSQELWLKEHEDETSNLALVRRILEQHGIEIPSWSSR